MTVVQPKHLTAPAITARPGELLDVATVVEGINWLDPTDLFESYNCLSTGSRAVWPCPTPGGAKTFTSPGWPDGIRFAVYGGVTCKGIGNSLEHEQSELAAAFAANESVGVEQALIHDLFTVPAATDITPAGGAVSTAVALGLLEGYAAAHYAGVPTIHAPRTIGTLLFRDQVIERVGNSFVSKQGSKIASGGGYQNPNNGPTGAAPAAGELWMYASGEVVIARGEVISQVSLDQGTNEVIALAERAYVAAVDCFTAAIKVKVA